MRTIKKVLGLVLTVTICVLGLVSCGGKYTTEYVDAKTGETKSISGEMYISAVGYKINSEPSYMLLGEDGTVYFASNQNKNFAPDRYVEITWEKLSDNVYRIATQTYYKTEKYLIAFDNGYVYMKVDGFIDANEWYYYFN